MAKKTYMYGFTPGAESNAKSTKLPGRGFGTFPAESNSILFHGKSVGKNLLIHFTIVLFGRGRYTTNNIDHVR
jgi:hypothetical protein